MSFNSKQQNYRWISNIATIFAGLFAYAVFSKIFLFLPLLIIAVVLAYHANSKFYHSNKLGRQFSLLSFFLCGINLFGALFGSPTNLLFAGIMFYFGYLQDKQV